MKVEEGLHALFHLLAPGKKAEVDRLFQETLVMLKTGSDGSRIDERLHTVFSLLAPDKKIVFCRLYFERIGHLAINTDLFMRRKQLYGIPPDALYIFLSGPPANRQLLEMWKRHLNIIENEQLLNFLYSDELKASDPIFMRNRSEYYEFNNADPTLTFTEEEKERGRAGLKEMGIAENDWFVCVFARDQEYLQTLYPDLNLDYHEYRNADINTFRKAIDYIVGLGGYVVRMGSKVAQALDYDHPKVIDYATRYRTDFMDIYLGAHCRFWLGTPSGIGEVACIFDVPQYSVNVAPPGIPPFKKNCFYIPKKLKDRDTGEYLPFGKFYSNFKLWDQPGIMNGVQQYEMGYAYEDNSEDEILDLAVEAVQRHEGTFVRTAADEEFLQAYYDLFPPDHFAVNVKSPVGRDFLRKNNFLFSA